MAFGQAKGTDAAGGANVTGSNSLRPKARPAIGGI